MLYTITFINTSICYNINITYYILYYTYIHMIEGGRERERMNENG